MGWTTIQDIRELPLWKNHHAVVLYSYIAMSSDYTTRETKRSIRTMARHCQLSVAAVRHALSQLQRAGLVECYATAAQTTCVLPAANRKPAGVTIDQAAALLNENLDNIARTLQLSAQRTAAIISKFCERQELAGKTWKDSRDLCSHLVNWWYRQPKQVTAAVSDTVTEQQRNDAESYERKRHAWMEALPAWREEIRQLRAIQADTAASADERAKATAELESGNAKYAITQYAKYGIAL